MLLLKWCFSVRELAETNTFYPSKSDIDKHICCLVWIVAMLIGYSLVGALHHLVNKMKVSLGRSGVGFGRIVSKLPILSMQKCIEADLLLAGLYVVALISLLVVFKIFTLLPDWLTSCNIVAYVLLVQLIFHILILPIKLSCRILNVSFLPFVCTLFVHVVGFVLSLGALYLTFGFNPKSMLPFDLEQSQETALQFLHRYLAPIQ